MHKKIVIIATALLVIFIGVTRPNNNWDIIGYVAAAFKQDGYNGVELKTRTYDSIRAEVSRDIFHGLTASSEYVKTVYEDPVALEQQLPFYSIRVVYVEMLRGLHKIFGISYPRGTHLISSIFSSLSVLILGMFFLRLNLPILFFPLVVVSTGFISIARFSTPDAIACFFSLSALWYLTFYSQKKMLYIISAFLPLIRTDFIILSFLLMAYIFNSKNKIWPLASILISIACYLLVNKLSNNYGWLTIFNFTLIELTPYPVNLEPTTEIYMYIRAYILGILQLVTNQHFIIYIFGFYLIWLKRESIKIDSQNYALCYILILFVIIHMILFPAYFDRFFVFAAALFFMWSLNILFLNKTGKLEEG
jgi:hypothetical protein